MTFSGLALTIAACSVSDVSSVQPDVAVEPDKIDPARSATAAPPRSPVPSNIESATPNTVTSVRLATPAVPDFETRDDADADYAQQSSATLELDDIATPEPVVRRTVTPDPTPSPTPRVVESRTPTATPSPGTSTSFPGNAYGDGEVLVKFEVLVPDWTPVQDLIFVSIEGFYFGENGGVPMVRREHRLWTAEYLAEANQLLEYKYNRNDFGFSTDEQFLPDSDETRRAIEVGTESMSVRDEITGWRWLSKEVPQAQTSTFLPDQLGDEGERIVVGVFPLDFYSGTFDDHVASTMEPLKRGGFEYVGIAYSAAAIIETDPPRTTFEPINTYTEEQLELSFSVVRGQGLKLALSVGVETDPRSAGRFEEIEASFRREHSDEWYVRLASEWESAMMRAARLAQKHRVEVLVISNQWPFWGMKTEAQKVTLNALINRTIERMRTVYSGKITSDYYSDDEAFDYYRQLDWVGDKWWWPLTTERDPALVDLTSEAQSIVDSRYRPIYEKYGKPIFLSQIAYASYDGAAGADQLSTEAPEIAEWFPYDEAYPSDFQEQADAYEAVFQAIHDEPIFAAAFSFSYAYWDSHDKSTGIRGKPAEQVWTRWAGILRNRSTAKKEFEREQGCADEPVPLFTSHITDLNKIDFIIPTNVMSGNRFKNRSYLWIGSGVSGEPHEVPVFAPADSKLTALVFYVEPMQDEVDQWVDVEQYPLSFDVTCEVSFGFDHLWRLSPRLDAIAPAVPATSTSGGRLETPLFVEAGELIGYTVGTIRAHNWDFVLTNSSIRREFANQDRYESFGNLWNLVTADCPYEYFADELKPDYYRLLGGPSGTVDGARCNFSYDHVGSVAGGWFQQPFAGGHPATHDPGWGVIVGSAPDGEVSVNGEGVSIRVRPGQPTHVDPKSITSRHCYEQYAGPDRPPHAFAFLTLLSDTELAVSFGRGACPEEPPGGYDVYFR